MQIPTDLKCNPLDIVSRGILRDERTKKIRSRIGILLSIYFENGSAASRRHDILECLEEYISTFRGKLTHYQVPNERRYRKWDGTDLPAVYRSIDRQKDADLYVSVSRENADGPDDPSLWRFLAFGFGSRRVDRPLSGLKAHFPPGLVFEDPDRFILLMRRWADRLQVLHGSSGLGVLSIPGTELSGDPNYYPWLERYPALEYDAMGSYFNESSDNEKYRKPRASNWITFLGEENVAALGGIAAIEAKLTPDMEMISAGKGLLVRACPLPVLGDIPNGGVPEGYSTIARIIEPIRFESYQFGVIKMPPELAASREERVLGTLNWIRRFD